MERGVSEPGRGAQTTSHIFEDASDVYISDARRKAFGLPPRQAAPSVPKAKEGTSVKKGLSCSHQMSICPVCDKPFSISVIQSHTQKHFAAVDEALQARATGCFQSSIGTQQANHSKVIVLDDSDDNEDHGIDGKGNSPGITTSRGISSRMTSVASIEAPLASISSAAAPSADGDDDPSECDAVTCTSDECAQEQQLSERTELQMARLLHRTTTVYTIDDEDEGEADDEVAAASSKSRRKGAWEHRAPVIHGAQRDMTPVVHNLDSPTAEPQSADVMWVDHLAEQHDMQLQRAVLQSLKSHSATAQPDSFACSAVSCSSASAKRKASATSSQAPKKSGDASTKAHATSKSKGTSSRQATLFELVGLQSQKRSKSALPDLPPPTAAQLARCRQVVLASLKQLKLATQATPSSFVSIVPRNSSCPLERQEPANVTTGIFKALLSACEKQVTKWPDRSYVLTSYNTHFHQRGEGRRWTCGYRNIQAVSQFLISTQDTYSARLFGGTGFVPSLSGLQAEIERAWDAGFDVESQIQLGSLRGSGKWIGPSEAWALFRFYGLNANLVNFSKTSTTVGYYHLGEWVWHYFNESAKRHGSSVTVSGACPLFFQHDGHSRLIVGAERRRYKLKPDTISLLVCDPQHSGRYLLRALHDGSWPKAIKRGLPTLRKPQYQLLFVDGFLDPASAKHRKQLECVASFGDTVDVAQS
eukprot:m.67333 g.67333  ORF g.67333 m.67333 type:complete len:702 (+) comp12160_c0_seq11:172-2277(+)